MSFSVPLQQSEQAEASTTGLRGAAGLNEVGPDRDPVLITRGGYVQAEPRLRSRIRPGRHIEGPARRRWREHLHSKDIGLVYLVGLSARGRVGRAASIVVSRLGDGWFYAIAVSLLLLQFGGRAISIIAVAAVNASIAHALYPWLKRRIRRLRPFQADPRLTSLLAVRDEHSFPSGHTMTLTTALVPVAYGVPHFFIPGLALVLIMAWARVASAHHYVSDVCAGILIGSAIAFPMTGFLLPELR